jgi:hypothetical protein
VEDNRLGLSVFAGTLESLVDEVAMDLVMLWRHLAEEDDALLTADAVEVKRHLRSMAEEAPIGS